MERNSRPDGNAGDARDKPKNERDVLMIEEILRRAREIHRQHGGVFGYDSEDWAQAWSELPERSSLRKLHLANEEDSGPTTDDRKEVSEPCFGFDN
jgi:hypothetical protein